MENPSQPKTFNPGTLSQATKILSLVAEQKPETEQLQKLLKSSLLSILLRCKEPEKVDHDLFTSILNIEMLSPIAIYDKVCRWAEDLRKNQSVSMLDFYHGKLGFPPGSFGDQDHECLCYFTCCVSICGAHADSRIKRIKAARLTLEAYGVTPEELASSKEYRYYHLISRPDTMQLFGCTTPISLFTCVAKFLAER